MEIKIDKLSLKVSKQLLLTLCLKMTPNDVNNVVVLENQHSVTKEVLLFHYCITLFLDIRA